MKFDPNKKMTIGARRTLQSIQEALFELLTKQDLDEIRVGALCEKAMIPRATFYNYFYDKYDVLQWILEGISADLAGGIDVEQDMTLRTPVIIDGMFVYFDQNADLLRAILRKNPADSTFYRYLEKTIRNSTQTMLEHCIHRDEYSVPLPLVARVNSYAILSVFEYIYVEGHTLSNREIHEMLDQLMVRKNEPEEG